LSRAAKYPFAQLKVGQSFFVPTEDQSFENLRVYCYNRTKEIGACFTATQEPGGTRIRRIDPPERKTYAIED